MEPWWDEAPPPPEDAPPPESWAEDPWAGAPPSTGRTTTRRPDAPRSTAAGAPAPSHGTAADVLHRVWGYDAFRGDQAAVVDTVVAGGDAVVLMPTGGGKSLCYQVPALVREGTPVHSLTGAGPG